MDLVSTVRRSRRTIKLIFAISGLCSALFWTANSPSDRRVIASDRVAGRRRVRTLAKAKSSKSGARREHQLRIATEDAKKLFLVSRTAGPSPETKPIMKSEKKTDKMPSRTSKTLEQIEITLTY